MLLGLRRLGGVDLTRRRPNGTILLARRRVLYPGELRCICAAVECYRRRQTPTTKNNTGPLHYV